MNRTCWLLLVIVAASPLQAAAPQTHMVAMRDGIKLATDVYLPETSGPWPVIFLRFPYNKALESNRQNGELPRSGEPRIANNTVLLGREGSSLLVPVASGQ